MVPYDFLFFAGALLYLNRAMLQQNYYQVLGLPNFAPHTEVKRAYKRMALRYHPDRNPDDPKAEELFKQVNEAYQVLSLPEAKAKYDVLLQNGYHFQYSAPHRSTRPAARRRPRRRTTTRPHRPFRREPEIKNYIATAIACLMVAIIYLLTSSFFDLRSRYHYLRALTEAERGNLSEAIVEAKISTNYDHSYARAHFLYGKLLLQTPGSKEAAAEALEWALEYAEWPFPEYYHTCAEAHLSVGEPDIAERYFLRAVQLSDYDTARIARLLPVFLRQLENETAVLTLSQKWLKQDSTTITPHWFSLLAVARQENEAAMWAKLDAVCHYAAQPEVRLRQLAEWYLKEQKSPALALQLYDRIIQDYQEAPQDWLAKGKLHHAAEDLATAGRSYTMAIFRQPDFAEAYYQRALAWLDRGKSKAACRDWRQARRYGFRGRNRTLSFFCDE